MPSFSPDGQRIAFTWDGPKQDNSDIYVTQIGESEPVRLTTDPVIDYAPAWSPNGRSIAFLRSGGVFLVPAIGGPARKIADARALNRLSWHPGGKWLLAADRASEREPQALIALSADTGEKRTLTFPPRTGVQGDRDPAVSPDGRSVVFVRRISTNRSDLYFLELSKDILPIGQPRRLITPKSFNAEPAWVLDGRSILFVSGDTGHHPSLWRMALSGSSGPAALPERLPFEDAHWPAISRRHLVYARRVWDFDIWRLELNSDRKSERMPMNSTRLDHTPRYSPDGSRIAFASDRSGSHEIWTCNADGSNAAKLTSFGGPYVSDPAWSPDGRRIAFVVEADGTITIYLIGSEGGTPVRLLNRDWVHGLNPSWSGDGKWIYFGAMDSGIVQLFRVPASGGEPKRITNNGGTAGFESPDGTYLYYRKDSDPGLWKVPVAGGEEARVLVSMLPQYFGVTRRGVYFFSSEFNPAIQLLNSATGRVEMIADLQLPGKSPVSFVLGWGLSVSREDRSLLYVKREDRGIDLMLVENFR